MPYLSLRELVSTWQTGRKRRKLIKTSQAQQLFGSAANNQLVQELRAQLIPRQEAEMEEEMRKRLNQLIDKKLKILRLKSGHISVPARPAKRRGEAWHETEDWLNALRSVKLRQQVTAN